jgi:hypothetical protein
MAIVLDGTAGITTPDLTDTSLTSGRVVYAGTSGNLTGSAAFIFDAAGALIVGSSANDFVTYGAISQFRKDQNTPSLLTVTNQNSGSSGSAGTIFSAFGNSWVNSIGTAAKNSNALTWAVDATASPPSVKMTLDTSGNLGLGTAPSAWGAGTSVIDLNTGGSAGAIASSGTLSIANNGFFNGTNWIYKNSSTALTYQLISGQHRWNIAASGTAGNTISFTQAMTLDASGNLLVGTTVTTPAQSNVTGFKVGGGQIECNGVDTQAAILGRSNNGQVILFYSAGSQAGNISNSSTTTSYNGTSDYRLKENITPLTNALAVVAQLKPCTYTWKYDNRLDNGFIAHELQEVLPNAVTGEKDAVDKNGNPQYQGIDPRMIVATLTAAIQEQQALITTLTERITALEGA